MRKRLKRWLKKREKTIVKYRWIIITLAIIAGLLILFYGAKLFLFLNFLLGNDIVVKLDTSHEDLFLENNQEQEVTFTASVITNPFCTADCSILFEDLSRGTEIERKAFALRPSSPYEQEYTLTAPRHGHGQELYRFKMECRSVQTVLCHTDEEPTTRSSLITLTHDLTPQQEAEKVRLQTELTDLQERLANVRAEVEALQNLTTHPVLDLPNLEEQLGRVGEIEEILRDHHARWQQELYEDIYTTHTLLLLEELENNQAVNELPVTIDSYNQLLLELHLLHDSFTLEPVLNASIATTLNDSIAFFNDRVVAFQSRSPISKKRAAISHIQGELPFLYNLTTIAKDEAAERETQLNAIQNLACDLGVCPMINNTSPCERTELLEQALSPYNGTGNTTAIRLLLENASAIVNETNTSLLNALAKEIKECQSFTVETPAIVTVEPITVPPRELPTYDFAFTEPAATCCVFGECNACCESCSNEHYPIILVHGHAFNKDTLADYSLEAFKNIQDRLEQDGYLDAGTISLYTKVDSPPGVRGKAPVTLTMKASYYFDIFQEPENYLVVQTKSENIDTYAVRMKDLIDTARQKTGKDKVIVISHSMGGLVTRRYMQIFGEDHVDKLIMIGTPNRGITGNIRDYCSLIGERLECRDMHEDSLVMNKLAQQRLTIPTYSIIGSGCDTDGSDGDGVVIVEHAKLQGAENVIVAGSCTRLKPLHTELLDIEKYPAVYETLIDALASS